LSVPFVLGFVRIMRRLARLTDMEDFANEYLEKLGKFYTRSDKDSETYSWLIHRSKKMQNQLGSQGILVAFQLLIAKYQYKNYSIILNILPELHITINDRVFSRGDLPHSYAKLLQETLVCHIGH